MNPSTQINNFLSIDVEDYFQVHALSNVVDFEKWDDYECRVEKNTFYILDHLDAASNTQNRTGKLSKATFFILGWIAERYPNLIKEIHSRGHEIASHGYGHRVIYNQTPKEFQKDVRQSKKILEDLTGSEVLGYRAPTYSKNKKTLWALNILAEEGYKYDSSVFPVRHDNYGIPSAPRFPFVWDLSRENHPEIKSFSEYNATSGSNENSMIVEFPISTVKVINHKFPCSGGGYFRIFPYYFTRMCLNHINKGGQPFIFYLHPWEIDASQPKVYDAPRLSRFRHYVNLAKTESRLLEFLEAFKDCSFIACQEYIDSVSQ